MTLQDHLAGARVRLERAGINPSEASRDAELLARHALGWDRARMIAESRDGVPDDFLPRYGRLVSRRERREPVSYIIGRREFWGMDLDVSSDVLIPRPETELIVQAALGCLATGTPDHPVVVDVGTGSGCLAIALAVERPDARIIATDVSERALAVARRNAVRHGVEPRIMFVAGRYLEGLQLAAHLVVSNPPYVPEGVLDALSPEVRDYEPRVALAAGVDGLSGIRTLLEQAWMTVVNGGWLIFEFGFGQEEAVRSLIAQTGYWDVKAFGRDLQGLPRVVALRRRAPEGSFSQR